MSSKLWKEILFVGILGFALFAIEHVARKRLGL